MSNIYQDIFCILYSMDFFTVTYVVEFFAFAILFFLVSTSAISPILHNSRYFLAAVWVVVVLQIIAAALLKQEVGDVMLFSGAGHYLRQQVDFYWIDQFHTQYPFFPFQIFLYAGLNWLTTMFPFLTFSFFLKIFLLFPLHFLAMMIQRRQEIKTTISESRRLRLQFLLNPITYSVVFFHGQTDVVLLAFLFAASGFLVTKQTLTRTLLGSLLYACSVATKTWSVLLIPFFIKFQKTLFHSGLFIATTGFFLLANIYLYVNVVFGSSVTTVLSAISSAGGPIGVWGVSLLLAPWLEIITTYRLEIFLVGLSVIYTLILFRSLSYWNSLFVFILGLYVIMINWGVQYVFWVVPSMYFLHDWVNDRFRKIFLLLASTYVFFAYINIAQADQLISQNIVHLTGFGLWITSIIGFIIHLRRSKLLTFNQILTLVISKLSLKQ